MKALLALLALALALPFQGRATVVYSENFSSYALATALTANPPNYVTTGSSGAWVTAAGLSDKVAQNPTVGGANWAHAMYNGASFTYTDLTVRCKRGTQRANIFARVTSLSGVNSIPTDGYQVQVIAGSTILYKGGYVTNLGSWAGNPANVNDFTVRLLCNGDQISVYIDGTLRVGPVTDATHSSGKVGIGTFAGTDALFTDISVDDGTQTQDLSPRQWDINTPKMYPSYPLFMRLFLAPSDAFALEADSRPVATAVAGRALRSRYEYTERLALEGRVTMARTPTPRPRPSHSETSTLTPVPRAVLTATPTRTR